MRSPSSESKLVRLSRDLSRALGGLRFGPPVTHVYNPLEYAREPHERYLRRYGRGRPDIVFIGMNPGPWGMAQTGVPFGSIGPVRGWLGIGGRVGAPERAHPRRAVRGFACHRREVSGERLWGWARRRFGTPERFFARCFVLNYCPLLFLEESGRNRTPDKLPSAERRALVEACNRTLRLAIEALRPRYVVGVGRFAAARAAEALAGLDVTIGSIPHPSPASPAANRDWEASAERALRAMGIRLDPAPRAPRPARKKPARRKR